MLIAGAAVGFMVLDKEPAGEPALSKVYSPVTLECNLVSESVLNTYVPGARCTTQAFAGITQKGVQSSNPNWVVESSAQEPNAIQLILTLSNTAPQSFAEARETNITGFTGIHKDPTTTAIEIGDEAYLLTGTSNYGTPGADARIVARSGNAIIDVTFKGFVNVPTSSDAVKAIATNILSNLH